MNGIATFPIGLVGVVCVIMSRKDITNNSVVIFFNFVLFIFMCFGKTANNIVGKLNFCVKLQTISYVCTCVLVLVSNCMKNMFTKIQFIFCVRTFVWMFVSTEIK